jgi:hypothetical protein
MLLVGYREMTLRKGELGTSAQEIIRLVKTYLPISYRFQDLRNVLLLFLSEMKVLWPKKSSGNIILTMGIRRDGMQYYNEGNS